MHNIIKPFKHGIKRVILKKLLTDANNNILTRILSPLTLRELSISTIIRVLSNNLLKSSNNGAFVCSITTIDQQREQREFWIAHGFCGTPRNHSYLIDIIYVYIF